MGGQAGAWRGMRQLSKKRRKKKKEREKSMGRGRVLLKVWPVDQVHLHHIGTWKFKFSAPTLDLLNQNL